MFVLTFLIFAFSFLAFYALQESKVRCAVQHLAWTLLICNLSFTLPSFDVTTSEYSKSLPLADILRVVAVRFYISEKPYGNILNKSVIRD